MVNPFPIPMKFLKLMLGSQQTKKEDKIMSGGRGEALRGKIMTGLTSHFILGSEGLSLGETLKI